MVIRNCLNAMTSNKPDYALKTVNYLIHTKVTNKRFNVKYKRNKNESHLNQSRITIGQSQMIEFIVNIVWIEFIVVFFCECVL